MNAKAFLELMKNDTKANAYIEMLSNNETKNLIQNFIDETDLVRDQWEYNAMKTAFIAYIDNYIYPPLGERSPRRRDRSRSPRRSRRRERSRSISRSPGPKTRNVMIQHVDVVNIYK